MKNMALIEWAIVVALVMVVVAIVFDGTVARKEFKAACDEIGGTTVFDGSRRQCLKK
jgi:hypothetical protein